MLQKILSWFNNRKLKNTGTEVRPETYSREQLEKAFVLGYNDGKRDGLAVAREQATRSLREILKSQNQKH